MLLLLERCENFLENAKISAENYDSAIIYYCVALHKFATFYYFKFTLCYHYLNVIAIVKIYDSNLDNIHYSAIIVNVIRYRHIIIA